MRRDRTHTGHLGHALRCEETWGIGGERIAVLWRDRGRALRVRGNIGQQRRDRGRALRIEEIYGVGGECMPVCGARRCGVGDERMPVCGATKAAPYGSKRYMAATVVSAEPVSGATEAVPHG